MSNIRTIRTSFGGGEISRELFGRMDIAKVLSGLDTCRNFIVMPHGAASNRPGTQFVDEIKDSSHQVRLISFSFSESQTFAIVMGAGYFRFYHDGGVLILNPPKPAYSVLIGYDVGDEVSYNGNNYRCIQAPVQPAFGPVAEDWEYLNTIAYEVENDYGQDDLADVHTVQSGDVITFVHPGHPPKELKRLGNLNWTFTSISFASKTTAPATPTVTETYPHTGTDETFKYVITALNSLGFEESLGSTASAEVTNDLTIPGNYNTISWSAVTGAVRYNVYKYKAGTYGYIGQVAATSFKDDNILADLTRTIPMQDSPAVFSTANNYPSAVCYYEQRRFFAGTLNEPQNIWATQSASDYNMSYSIPSQASDALRFRIAAQRANSIKHLIPALDLLVLTASTEWRVYSASNDALSPTTVSIKSQAQNGANNVTPVVVDNFVLYAAAQGGHVREIAYQWQNNGYTSNDLCFLAPHLFDGKTIVDMAFSRAPTPCLWVITDDGALLGMTYVANQEVAAWHKHDTTNGVFESLCTVTENGADVLYVIVKRIIDGTVKRYVECLHSRIFDDISDAFFVDSGLTYSGAPATIISNLDHLEGQTVSVLGDGIHLATRVVSAGKITLPHAVSKAQIGLPITADLMTTPVTIQGDQSLGQSRVKNINKAWVRTYKTGKFAVGPDATRLTDLGTGALSSEELSLFVQPNYNQEGKIMIRQSDPLPITVVNITLEVSIGG